MRPKRTCVSPRMGASSGMDSQARVRSNAARLRRDERQPPRLLVACRRDFYAARPRPCERSDAGDSEREHAGCVDAWLMRTRPPRPAAPPRPRPPAPRPPCVRAKRVRRERQRMNAEMTARHPRATYQLRDCCLLKHGRILQHVRQQDVAAEPESLGTRAARHAVRP